MGRSGASSAGSMQAHRARTGHLRMSAIEIERKRAEDALAASERDLRLMVYSIPGMVAVFSAAGELQFVNNHTQEYYAATLEELKNWQAGRFTHPEDTPRSVEAFSRSIALGESFRRLVPPVSPRSRLWRAVPLHGIFGDPKS